MPAEPARRFRHRDCSRDRRGRPGRSRRSHSVFKGTRHAASDVQSEKVQEQVLRQRRRGSPSGATQERAESGIKLAQHVQTALTGGKIRKAFALSARGQALRVAAAGTGGVVEKIPPWQRPCSAAAWRRRRSTSCAKSMDTQDESAGRKTKTRTTSIANRPRTVRRTMPVRSRRIRRAGGEEGEEDETSNRNSRNGARQRASSRR